MHPLTQIAPSFPPAADTFVSGHNCNKLQLLIILEKVVCDFRVQISMATKTERRIVSVFHLPRMTLAVLRWLIKDFLVLFFKTFDFTKR